MKQTAIPLLVASTQSSSEELKASATATLSSLGAVESICPVLAKEGAIASLTRLLRTEDEEQKRNAASALANVAVNNTSNCEEIMDEGGMDPLVEILRGGTGKVLENAVFVVGSIAGCSKRHCKAVEKLGVVPLLVKMLHDGDLELKEHAAFALEGLTRSSETALAATSDLIELLRAVKEFGRVADDIARKKITRCGGVSALLGLVQSDSDVLNDEAAFALTCVT